MSIKKRAVRVYQVPEHVTSIVGSSFLGELRRHTESERPRFVLDCSRAVEMDRAAMLLLMSCLEEAMKSNGDVRLASLAPGAEAALSDAGVIRLFEVFSTPDAAVQSFHQRATSLAAAGATGKYGRAVHAA